MEPTREELIDALRKCDAYFRACARAWAVNDGRIVDADGRPFVEADGLDELCDVAATACCALVGRVDGKDMGLALS